MANITIFKDLLGKILVDILVKEDAVYFRTLDGFVIRFFHEQDCCESVWVEDIEGDINDLLHSRLLTAEELVKDGREEEEFGSTTWTFYRFATRKGFVTIRWCGQSSGYYSERVDYEIRRPYYPSDLTRYRHDF